MKTYIAEFSTRCGETTTRSILAATERSAANKARKMLYPRGGGKIKKGDLMEVSTIYPALLQL